MRLPLNVEGASDALGLPGPRLDTLLARESSRA